MGDLCTAATTTRHFAIRNLRLPIGMSDRPQDQSGNEPDAFSGKVEWLYDTLEDTTPRAGPRPRQGVPGGTLFLLLVGLLMLAGVAFLLIGPPP